MLRETVDSTMAACYGESMDYAEMPCITVEENDVEIEVGVEYDDTDEGVHDESTTASPHSLGGAIPSEVGSYDCWEL